MEGMKLKISAATIKKTISILKDYTILWLRILKLNPRINYLDLKNQMVLLVKIRENVFMKNLNCKKAQLRDLLRHSRLYQNRQFGRTGKTDERIKAATWLQNYK